MMKIPPGVDSGQSLRLRGKGWRDARGNHSDRIIRLKIVTPKELTEREREYYQKLHQASNFNPRRSIEEIRL
jgi:curved DNA-binding protein